jgi:2'-hydroxyisoflavone reductase
LTEILGDRDGQLDRLGDRTWDAVIDTCGYFPRIVGLSAATLHDRVERYLFISTISVYAIEGRSELDEASPVSTVADPTIEEITGESYGPLKALCEEAVRSQFGDRALILRPGIIVGPYDPSNRFTYWVTRLADGGQVLVPDRRDQPLQLIDVRDLADFAILALEHERSGLYNTCGPEAPATFDDMIAACGDGHEADLIWAQPSVLEVHEIALWQELTLALPQDGSQDAMMRVDCSRAISHGLVFRKWTEMARETLAMARSYGVPTAVRYGLDRNKEAAVLSQMISSS